MLSFSMDIRGPVALLGDLATRAANPASVLRRWGGYFRAQAVRRGESGEGWAALADSTMKHLALQRTSSVTVFGAVRKGYATKLEGYLRGQVRKGDEHAAGDLAELRRLRAGGAVARVGRKAAPWAGGKAVGRLQARLARAASQKEQGHRARVGGNKRKGDRHKLLGSLPRQVIWRLDGSLAVEAADRVPWAGVHNLGGTVGHGAKLPARTFLLINEEDRVVLGQILLEHLTGH